MKLGHGRDETRDQDEKARETAKAGHAATAQHTRAADIREAARLAVEGVINRAAKLEAKSQKLYDALEQETHAKEWQEHFKGVRASVDKAADALRHAAAAIAERQVSTAQLLHNELTENAAKARVEDVRLSPDEVMERQQEREEKIENQMASLAKHDLADVRRLEALEKQINREIFTLLRSQADLPEGADAPQRERLEAAEKRLETFDDAWRASLAMTLLFDGRFSDIKAVQETWQEAAAGKTNDADGFAKARRDFWHLVNAQKSEAAREAHRLLSVAKVEWRDESAAPLLDMGSKSIDRIRDAAQRGEARAEGWAREMDRNTRLSIDHVADKGTHEALTLAGSNLRLTTQSDNSARGASFDVGERAKLDFERSQAHQAKNAELRDERRAKSADRSLDKLQEKESVLAPARLRETQAVAQAAHEKHLRAAKEAHDGKLQELRDASVRRLEGESESAHHTRQQHLLELLERFLQSGREQLETLKAHELRLHDRQQEDLRKALQMVDAVSTQKDATARLVSITKQLAEEHRAAEGLWQEVAVQQNRSETLLLQAIYDARNREAQEEQVKQALAEQEKTRVFLRARMEERKREEGMAD